MTPIVSRRAPDRPTTVVVTLGLAALFALVPLMLMPASAASHSAVAVAIGLVCLALAALAMRAILRRDADTSAWMLSDDVLAGGLDGRHRIPLPDIVEVSVGVPADPRRPATVWHHGGLVLKLRDGRLLALNLSQAEHGPALMDALVVRCAPVFTTAPLHTERELALLHRLRWNRIVGADDRG
ncbi:MAG: hypothetical protein ACTHOH_15840 [Lysobacteraceae bacterium]